MRPDRKSNPTLKFLHVFFKLKGTHYEQISNAVIFVGHDLSSEGSTVWLTGNGDPWTDEEHVPVRCFRDQRIN